MGNSETTVTIDVDASDSSDYNKLPDFVNLSGEIEVRADTPNKGSREIALLFADQLEGVIKQTVSDLNSACYDSNGRKVETSQEVMERFERYSCDLRDYQGPAEGFERILIGNSHPEEDHD